MASVGEHSKNEQLVNFWTKPIIILRYDDIGRQRCQSWNKEQNSLYSALLIT